ncbi:baseplate J/gp47 family protein [Clostridium butyricum]|uniref:baseplate J/gp47 family protein n=1 Tax=Clostridium butyricum TaxID=1492 RepID=UPI002ABE8CB7|nr:baseplate J/gp47 family protein [Clostridium butyricum]
MAETKETILNRMLNRIDSSYDTAEGSFFYDLNSPAAIEINKLQSKADEVLKHRFVTTAIGEYLTKICAEMGVNRNAATYATGTVLIKGIPGSLINKGEKVSSDLINFLFIENKVVPESGEITINIECETKGPIGNLPIGTIKSFPKTLEGLQSVENREPTSGGYEEETDESLRERYFIKVRTPATSGNKYHYLGWAREVSGVGGAKVVPLWSGNGTVKVIIIDSNKKAANEKLIKSTFDNIENQRPIGATVTVVSGVEKLLTISVKIILANGYPLNQVKNNIKSAIEKYLSDQAFKITYVSIAKIGNLILNTEGVVDYENLKINNSSSNYSLNDDEIAVLNNIDLVV